MEESFAVLIGLLEKQTQIYNELLEISQEKQQELICGNLAALDNLTKREELLIYQAGRLEEGRQSCAHILLERYGLPEKSTLKKLLKKAAAQEKERLEELSGILNAIIQELSRRNTENMDLIEQSLKYVNYSITSLTRAEGQSTTYNSGRELKSDNVIRLVDRKV